MFYSTSTKKLKQALLRKDAGTGFAYVNFDPALVCLLHEAKYFLLLGLDVPESAMHIFELAETYRQWTGNLDLIVNIYNSILETVLDVERPLIQQKLDNIDKVLLKGQTRLNWKSSGINEFITQSMSQVKELKGQVNLNFKLSSVSSIVILYRKATRVLTFENLSPAH